MKKRILSLVLTLCLLLPATLTAAEAAETTYTMTYNGVTVTVPAETKAPESTVIDGKTVVAWQYGDKTVAVGDEMTLSEDTVLTPVTIDAPKTSKEADFKLAEYTSAGKPSELALRFRATLSRADFSTLRALGTVRLGMLITPESYVLMAGEFTKEALNRLPTKNGAYVDVPVDGYYEVTEEDYVLAASLMSFSSTTLTNNPAFAAVLYATVTTPSGHTFTVYGDFDVTATHGVMDLATEIANDKENELCDVQRGWLTTLLSAFEANGASLNENGIFLNVDINTVTFPFLQAVVADGKVTEEELRAFVMQYKDTQITDLAFDVFCQISFTESDAWSDVLDSYHRTEENGFAVDWKDELYHYHELYEVYEIDPHAVWFDACRDAGITSWLTVRMNDCHNPTSDNMWFRGEEHYIAKENGWMIGSRYGHQQICYNYAVEEVRTWMLNYIEEQIMRYDVDGLELDFSREWYCFPYLDYLGSTEHVEIMNDFIRDVNAIVEAAEGKWGHDVKIKIKLMRDIEQNLVLGFDAETYYFEGLCDIIGVAPRWASNDSDMPIDEWKASFPGIEIHPTVTDLTWNKQPLYETAAGYSAAYLALGGDKINLYNYFSNPNRPQEKTTKLYDTAGSLKTLVGTPRRVIVAYQDVTPSGYTQYKPLPAKANGLTVDLLTGPVGADELVYLVVAVDTKLNPGDLIATVNGYELVFYGETEAATYYAGSAYQYCYLLPAHLAKQLSQSITLASARDITVSHMELIFGDKTVPSALTLPADEIVSVANRWQVVNRWDFTDSVADSVGGVTVTPVKTHAKTPTFENGRIVLDGNTVYTLDTPIAFNADEDFKVVIKGKFNFDPSTGAGAKRIFGSATGVNSGINYININTAQYGNGYAVSFSPKTSNWNSYVYLPDRTQFDMTEEHELSFMSYNRYLYVYMDGVLMCKRALENSDDFSFTDFLGCSYITSGITYNTVGEIDYIAIATLTDTPLSTVLPMDTDRDLAVQPTTPDEAITADNWELIHRWSFNGSVTDDIGGVTVTQAANHMTAPTYTADGKIILGGNTSYVFDTPIELSATDNFKVVVKGSLDFGTATGAGVRRILGSASGVNSGVCYININDATYKGYSFSFSPKTNNWNSYVLYPDKTAFDITSGEHTLEFLQFNGYLYLYIDGALAAKRTAVSSGDYIFTDFLGCSYAGTAYSTVGTVDYVAIAKLGKYTPEEKAVFDTDRDLAPEISSADEARESDNYEILHRFDFTDGVYDSVGGLTVIPDDVHKTVPTYENGNVVLNGHTAYTLSAPISLSATDNFKVVVKGQFDMSAATGIGVKRIFGSASGQNSSVCYMNLNTAEYGNGYGFALSPVTGAFGSYVLKPDKTKHDVTSGMHTLEFMQFNGQIYLYFDGELMASRAAKNGDGFRFTEFLGCTYDNSIAYNTVGTIDHITVGLLSPYLVDEAPVWDADGESVTPPVTPEEPTPTYPTTADEAVTSTLWENLHAWEFEGNVNDSVGGATLTQMAAHNVAPTYADGKIVLGGRTAYTIDTPIEFAATDNFKVAIKAKFTLNANAQGSKRIFGSPTGKNAGIYYLNLTMSPFNGYAMAFCPTTSNFNYYSQALDQSTFDITEEHLLEFMYFEGVLYAYMDGTLMFQKTNIDGGFSFTELFGCSYGGANANYSTVGEIDYLRIATLEK